MGKDRLSKKDQKEFVRIFKEMSHAFDQLENGLFNRLGTQARVRREIHRLGGKVRTQIEGTRIFEFPEVPEGLDKLLEGFRWELHGKVLSISGWL
jgi:hypothetical protein